MPRKPGAAADRPGSRSPGPGAYGPDWDAPTTPSGLHCPQWL